MIVNFLDAPIDHLLNLGFDNEVNSEMYADDYEKDPNVETAQSIAKNGIETLKNFYEKYSKIFINLETIKKKDIKSLFKACSYVKFSFLWSDGNDSNISMPIELSLGYKEFYENQEKKTDLIATKVLRLRENILKNWQLQILEDIQVYILGAKKVENVTVKPFPFRTYTPIKGSIFEDIFWDNFLDNLKEKNQDLGEYIEYIEKNIVLFLRKKLNSSDHNIFNYKIVENLENCNDPDRQEFEIETKKKISSEEDCTYFVSPNYENFDFPQHKIVKSFVSLSKGDFTFLPKQPDYLFDFFCESVVYKIYDREKNVFKFSKTEQDLNLYTKETNSFQNLIENSQFYTIYSIPMDDENILKKDNENVSKKYVFCFLDKNDIYDLNFDRKNIYETNLKNYKILQKNLGSFYKKYLVQSNQIVNNEKNEEEIVIIPFLKNGNELDCILDFKKEKIFEELAGIKMYLLDLSSDIPFLKISNFDKNNIENKVYFYPLKKRKINLYLPYSFEKENLINFCKNLNKENSVFRNLLKKNRLKISSEPRIIETNLSEFLNITKGFSLKNREIITIKI